MLDTIYAILNANAFTYYVVGSLTMFAAVIINALTDSRAIALSLVPPLWLGGLAGIFAFHAFNVVITPDKDSDVVIAATGGMAAGLLVALALARVYFLVTRNSKAFAKADIGR
jgi:hypothetical protein